MTFFPIRFSAKNIKEYVRNGLILLSQNNQNISLTDIRLSVTLCIINLKQVDSFLITKFSGIMKVQRNLYKWGRQNDTNVKYSIMIITRPLNPLIKLLKHFQNFVLKIDRLGINEKQCILNIDLVMNEFFKQNR